MISPRIFFKETARASFSPANILLKADVTLCQSGYNAFRFPSFSNS
jgi:hypothetical protein